MYFEPDIAVVLLVGGLVRRERFPRLSPQCCQKGVKALASLSGYSNGDKLYAYLCTYVGGILTALSENRKQTTTLNENVPSGWSGEFRGFNTEIIQFLQWI